MATITRFEDLKVWQLARQLASEIYQLATRSEAFSKEYKLKEQINASSGSAIDKIAEGFERGGRNKFINFLSIAKGSGGEIKSQLYRAFDRKYISRERFEHLYNKAEEFCKQIGALMKYLNRSTYRGTKFKERETTQNPKP